MGSWAGRKCDRGKLNKELVEGNVLLGEMCC